jgi:molybdopterin synthase catalytic subunit
MEQFLINTPIYNELICKELNLLNNDLSCGGHVCFLGTVRADNLHGKIVNAIEYSAYSEMAEIEFSRLKNIILSKYNDLKKIVIYHSLGSVKTGENSLFILISTGHRKQAFEAITEIVDLIKENVPIWKKEIFEDGTYFWTE